MKRQRFMDIVERASTIQILGEFLEYKNYFKRILPENECDVLLVMETIEKIINTQSGLVAKDIEVFEE